jgi:hypothetical protein
MDAYKGIPIIDVTPGARGYDQTLYPREFGRGLVPRDYDLYPQEFLGSPDEMELADPSEWDARFDEQEETESSLEHIYLRGGVPAFTNLDQDQEGYCWGYSVGHAMMFTELRDRGPEAVTRLNPHGPCAVIKRGANEGGWCGLSARFAAEVGFPEEGDGPGQWPLHSRNIRLDTPAMRAAMARRKTTEEWRDLTRQDWGQKMTSRQLATCGFMNVPAACDFNWWGHSVCQIRWVRIERGSWGPLIINSWKRWGRHGLAVLRGSQAVANGAVAIRTTTLSARRVSIAGEPQTAA